ncbi:MAG: 16S rRNA (adenine1518-N6/adenine1519-N6)-dimethyltransferase [Polyangiales bacterium]|jgi:16S rRNA (adenine1518-N6/adenine1519-N6)-dimethyltransferase
MTQQGPEWEDPRHVLSRHGARPKRRFSQNFLTDPQVVDAIASAVRPGDGECIVELGPGAGTLTAALLRQGAHVIGVEADPAMRALLEAEFRDYPLTVVDADAAALDLSSAELRGSKSPGERIAVCGNLPYAISGSIFRRLVAERERIDRAIIMVQREVALRLAANAGEKAYGALSVFIGTVFSVEPVLRVKPDSFFPAPRVESAVVRLTPLANERAPVDDERFVTVVRAAFGMRRKTLRNALKRIDGSAEALEAAGIDGGRRGETLTPEEFASVAAALPTPPVES